MKSDKSEEKETKTYFPSCSTYVNFVYKANKHQGNRLPVALDKYALQH